MDYKQTKFMLSLYGEIKSYVERIKSILNKQLEKLTLQQETKSYQVVGEEARLIVSYLLIFGEDRNHVRA